MKFEYLPGFVGCSGAWVLPDHDGVYISLGRPRKGQRPCSESLLKLVRYYDPKNPPRLSSAHSLDGSAMLRQADELERGAEELLQRMKGYR